MKSIVALQGLAILLILLGFVWFGPAAASLGESFVSAPDFRSWTQSITGSPSWRQGGLVRLLFVCLGSLPGLFSVVAGLIFWRCAKTAKRERLGKSSFDGRR